MIELITHLEKFPSIQINELKKITKNDVINEYNINTILGTSQISERIKDKINEVLKGDEISHYEISQTRSHFLLKRYTFNQHKFISQIFKTLIFLMGLKQTTQMT
jgi:hypothetical protein